MAMCERYTCAGCGYSIEGWDDGNPYLEYPPGKRHYFYHPGGPDTLAKALRPIMGREPSAAEIQGLLREHGGNAPDHLCPDCGKVSKIDAPKDPMVCRNCGSARIFDMWRCQGNPCPKCGGSFSEGKFYAIS